MSWQTIVEKKKLEVSIVNLSELEGQERLDPDFYTQEHLRVKRLITSLEHKLLKDVCAKITDGTHYTPTYIEMGTPFLSALNVLENQLSLRSYNFISEEEHNKLTRRAKTEAGDVLLRKVGVGPRYATVVPEEIFDFSIFVSLALLKIKSEYKYISYYLSTFINSYYGQNQLLRFNKGISQPDLHLEDIRELQIPIPSNQLILAIEKNVIQCSELSSESSKIYREAEQLLLKEINLVGYKATDTGVSVRNFSDVLASNRFDAEYWQPKYDEIEKRVSHVAQKELGDIASAQKGVEVGSEAYLDSGKDFVRVADFSIYGIEKTEKKISQELYDKLSSNKPKKGEVLFTKDGTMGISFALNEDVDAILSSAFLRLKPKVKINTTYLALVLNSFYCKAQIERMSGGAIIAHLKPDCAMRIKIPMLSEEKQGELAEKIVVALRLRQEAKMLLEKAKRAVEIFVEEDEKEALAFLVE